MRSDMQGGGVHGRLHARFAAGPDGGLRYSSSTPLELRGPFPGPIPRFFLRNVTCGIFGGDNYHVDIRAEPGARAQLEPTSATKVHAMPHGAANSFVHLEAQPGSVLFYSSGLSILQQGSSLSQEIGVLLHPGALIVYSELVALGRLARGECLAFRRYASSFHVESPGGPLYEERFELLPDIAENVLQEAMGSGGVIGSLFLLGGSANTASLPDTGPEVYAGASTLPNGAGTVVRVIAQRPDLISRLFEDITTRERAAIDAREQSSGSATQGTKSVLHRVANARK